ncbi:MAG TPA: amidohydrolase [Solirubrobacteraceae bacterium]
MRTKLTAVTQSLPAADLIIKVGAIHAMDADRAVYRAIALRNEWIVAASEDPDGLDGLRTGSTRIIHEPPLTVLPAFFDTHEHLLEAARNLELVPLDRARTLDELIDLVRDRAGRTRPGQWIQTSSGWHESQLAEARLPTAAELDRATNAHPVLCPRGEYLCTANSMALRLAGLVDHSGSAPGVLEGRAAQAILRLVPHPSHEAEVERLGRACTAYSAIGVGAVREARLKPGQLVVYQRAWERGLLTLRCRVLLLVDSAWSLDERLAFVEAQQVTSGFGDDWLRLDGLKLVLDGGVSGAALDEPYADDPTRRGELKWERDEFAEVVEFAVGRGWRVATHAFGDRAVRTALDVYEQVARRHPGLPTATLTLEHALLAGTAQRARAARLGVAITVQHPWLYTHGAEMIRRWGPERTAAVMPLRSWLVDGALVSAGSDSVRPVNPLFCAWVMVTRETRDAGPQGLDEAVDRHTAIELLTRAGASLTGELHRRGTLQRGRLADLVAYDVDPLTVDIDQLPALEPVLTVVGGRATHDPAGRLGSDPSVERATQIPNAARSDVP